MARLRGKSQRRTRIFSEVAGALRTCAGLPAAAHGVKPGPAFPQGHRRRQSKQIGWVSGERIFPGHEVRHRSGAPWLERGCPFEINRDRIGGYGPASGDAGYC